MAVPSGEEVERRLAAISSLRAEHVEEIAANRRFLAGLSAAAVAGLVVTLAQPPANAIQHNLLRAAVVVAGLAVACSLVLLFRRERLIWGARWTEDALLRHDVTSHPEGQRFWQEDMQKTRTKTPSSRELRVWTALLVLLLSCSGILTAAAYW